MANAPIASASPKLVITAARLHPKAMDLTAATRRIEATFHAMHSAFGEAVFDEWAIISLGAESWTVVSYSGPRHETFRSDLPGDLKPLADTSTGKAHAVGDFEFATDARGTRHDAMLRLGGSTYLLCNNTQKAMAEIRSHRQWLPAQRFFATLSEAFHADPLVLPAAAE